jgi:hypothetical protein
LDGRLGGPQNQSGCCGVEKNLLALSKNETWQSRLYPVAILTELSYLNETHIIYKKRLNNFIFCPVILSSEMMQRNSAL